MPDAGFAECQLSELFGIGGPLTGTVALSPEQPTPGHCLAAIGRCASPGMAASARGRIVDVDGVGERHRLKNGMQLVV